VITNQLHDHSDNTMCLSGSNHSNLHVQAALPAVTDVIKSLIRS